MDTETKETILAQQRATVKWLLSKSFNNRVPDNLREPFYQDNERQEHLKPQIVVGLGNATLYCQALSNLYSDPNYQSLNHWSILQTLARKGVPVAESPEMPLTETVLIQTNPLRINAHMSVIESLMTLYAKEISSGDRIPNAIRRISGGSLPSNISQNYEQSLLTWISHAVAALKRRIDQEIEHGATDENGIRLQSPDIPPVQDFQGLCDGVCLALLISYYCPKVIPWNQVRINYLPSVEDSIHNVLLVISFSQKHLPYSVFHMTPEDVTYMRGSMKQNLVVLLADLFNLFEIHPAKCVCYPGMDNQERSKSAGYANEHGICHRRGLTCPPVNPIPDLRSDLDQPQLYASSSNRPPFQVTRSASANVITRKATPPKEYQTAVESNSHSSGQHEEGFVVHRSRGVTTLSSLNSQVQEPLVPARLRQAKEKTNTETKADERGDGQAAGKPSNWEQSRRPSFAGRRSRRNSLSEDSQLTIENFGGSQDQLNTIGRNYERDRERKSSTTSIEPALPIRSSIADARGTIQLGYDTDSGSEKQDRETEKNLRRQGSVDNISVKANVREREYSAEVEIATPIRKTSVYTQEEDVPRRKTSFATVNSNTTTWQQQSVLSNQSGSDEMYSEEDTRPLLDASKLSTIRLKLEEKRRRIEQEKKKVELELSKQQEKVGKAAFLQAINKDEMELCLDSKWETLSNDSKRTPDIDPIDLDKYHQSLAMMNSNLQDLQQDIHRLATQQSQITAQHLQAQQLMQAQQIANMLNQQQQPQPPLPQSQPQPYGSQQHIPGQYHHQPPLPQQQRSNFGSTPHLPNNSFGSSPNNAYNSRPPSRDPYSQQFPPQPQTMQYINDHGQYINHPPPPIYSRENSAFMNENGYNNHPQHHPQHTQNPNFNSYNNHHSNHYQQHYTSHPIEPSNQQYQSHQSYINRPPEYDEYPPSHRGRDPNSSPQPNQFYLHESSPQPTQRRTWAQSAQNAAQNFDNHHQQAHQLVDVNAWQSSKIQENRGGTWKSSQNNLHNNSNGGGNGSFLLHQNGEMGNLEKSYQNLFPVHSSPIHRQTPPRQQQQQQQQQQQRQQIPIDDMAPQSISFIGDEEDQVDQIEMNIEYLPSISTPIIRKNSQQLHQNQQIMRPQKMIISNDDRNYDQDFEPDISLSKLNITSGSLTYRIPSPSRPSLNANSFMDPQEDSSEQKGFYISFDDDQPKRPKPPLRAKRSPKKEKSFDSGLERKDIGHNQLQRQLSHNEKQIEMHNNSNNFENNRAATYNKYTDAPIQPVNITHNNSSMDRRHLEDVTNQQMMDSFTVHHTQNQLNSSSRLNEPKENKALIIGSELTNLDPDSVEEMEKRKEKIMLLSLQRRQRQEEDKARKELDLMQRREREREKEEEKSRKKEEQAQKRAAILEQHRLKKAMEEAEREGKTLDSTFAKHHVPQQSAGVRLRTQKPTRPRPKTIHVESGSVDISEASSLSSRGKKGSSMNLTESPDEYPSTSSTPIGRRGSYKTSREPTLERGRTLSRIAVPTSRGSTLNNFRGRKSNSLMNLCGPKLYKQPAAKSNRGIILNAVEYCVFPGAVNRDAKQKVLEKIARSEAKHFLVLFRDAGCQFRALYSYYPENESIVKLYGIGPSQVDEVMFDKFFKYNSGSKCFSQVHTKHLTVTIDAFTIHNSLWQGKKVHLPSKKDMALVV